MDMFQFKLDHGQVPTPLCALVFHVENRTRYISTSQSGCEDGEVPRKLRCVRMVPHTR